MTGQEAERAEFEKWIKSGQLFPSASIERSDDGTYINAFVVAWQGWQASARAENEACAKPIIELLEATELLRIIPKEQQYPVDLSKVLGKLLEAIRARQEPKP